MTTDTDTPRPTFRGSISKTVTFEDGEVMLTGQTNRRVNNSHRREAHEVEYQIDRATINSAWSNEPRRGSERWEHAVILHGRRVLKSGALSDQVLKVDAYRLSGSFTPHAELAELTKALADLHGYTEPVAVSVGEPTFHRVVRLDETGRIIWEGGPYYTDRAEAETLRTRYVDAEQDTADEFRFRVATITVAVG